MQSSIAPTSNSKGFSGCFWLRVWGPGFIVPGLGVCGAGLSGHLKFCGESVELGVQGSGKIRISKV